MSEERVPPRGSLFDYPNVVGYGIGRKLRRGEVVADRAQVVLVRQKKPMAALVAEDLIPQSFGMLPTDIVQVGHIIAHAADRTNEWRPAPPGVSIGHYQITAGTFGALVRSTVDGSKLILSNNHVLANSNEAGLGDDILQPGAYDGGREAIATLLNYVPIDFGEGPTECKLAQTYARIGNAAAKLLGRSSRVEAVYRNEAAENRMDAAVAAPLDDALVEENVLGIGLVSGVREATLGLDVIKSGRTTGVTTGKVSVLDATVVVDYGGKTATFVNQIITTHMSEPGDSGSLLVSNNDLKAVGLLFAGSDQVTIHSPIQPILSALAISI